MLELHCTRSSYDRLTAERDDDHGVIIEAHGGAGSDLSVYGTVEDTRAFAYGLLTLIGDSASPAPPEQHGTKARLEALESARKHVAELATNARGFMDGTAFSDREAAVRRVASFILGEG